MPILNCEDRAERSSFSTGVTFRTCFAKDLSMYELLFYACLVCSAIAQPTPPLKRDCTNRRPGQPAGSYLHLVERATTNTKIERIAGADSAGDGLSFGHNALYDATNTSDVGFAQGFCSRATTGKSGSYHCNVRGCARTRDLSVTPHPPRSSCGHASPLSPLSPRSPLVRNINFM